MVTYIDSIVTVMNPDINPDLATYISEQHPCQKPIEQLVNDFDDYCQLVNKVQKHTKCSPSSCLVLNKYTNLEECRFGYPKELCNFTIIQSNDNNQPKLLLRCNDSIVNSYCRILLQGWRVNIDIKPILSLHAALSYVTKYASKSELRSEAFSEIFSNYLKNAKSDEPALKSVQKLLLHTITERDFSAQESSHLLLKLPLAISSCTFFTLNLNEDNTLRKLIHDNNMQNNEQSSSVRTELSHLQVYWEWTPRKKNYVIRIWSCLSSVRLGPAWKDYCRLKFSAVIESDGNDLFELEENNIMIQEPWMQIATNSLQAITNDLGECFIDIHHMWSGSYIAFPNLSKVESFLKHAKCKQIETTFYNDNDKTLIDPSTLNNRQRQIFDYVILHYSKLLTNSDNQLIEPLCAIIMSTANTGKSYVIKAIRNRMFEIAREHNIDTKKEPPILVLVPTGVAAFNINGCTIHLALFLPSNFKNLELKAESLKKLQQKLKGVKITIFDEKSMISRRLLALPPVLNLPMYALDSRPNDPLSEAGLTLSQAVINIGNKEFAIGLTFVAISRV
ncbi:17939_t:CDS:2, partial [Cetraspora pellucida]